MTAVEHICLLRRVADRLRDGALGDDGLRFGAMLDGYLAHARAGLSLDAACGLAVPPGGEPWWRSEARERRAAYLREYAARFSPAGAVELAGALRDYRRHWQVRDRHLAELPSAYIGTPRELLFCAFAESDAGDMPASEKQLRRILSEASEGHETPSIHVPGDSVVSRDGDDTCSRAHLMTTD